MLKIAKSVIQSLRDALSNEPSNEDRQRTAYLSQERPGPAKQAAIEMSNEVIFDGEDIKLITSFGPEKGVVFSFSNFNPHTKFGDGFIQKIGYSAIFFISKHSHWWQSREMEAAIIAAQIAAKPFKNRISFGHSMGGYGALLSSGDLDSFCVVTAPQTVISEYEIPMHPTWREAISSRPIIKDNVKESIKGGRGVALIYDPRHLIDAAHANYIKEISSVNRVLAPFSTHLIPRSLLEMGVLSNVVEHLFEEPDRTIAARKKIRENRMRSALYCNTLIDTTSKRKPAALLEIAKNTAIKRMRNKNNNNDEFNHRFSIIFDRHLFRNIHKIKIDTNGASLKHANEQIVILSAEDRLLQSIGADPQIIIWLATQSMAKIRIVMYSSIESECYIFYTLQNDTNRAFTFRNSIARKVKIGFNDLIFEIKDKIINPEIRFDPLSCVGMFKIDAIEVQ